MLYSKKQKSQQEQNLKIKNCLNHSNTPLNGCVLIQDAKTVSRKLTPKRES